MQPMTMDNGEREGEWERERPTNTAKGGDDKDDGKSEKRPRVKNIETIVRAKYEQLHM